MKLKLLLVSALALFVGASASLNAQETKAVKTIAGILMTVNHFPNDEQKKTLTALSAEAATTAQEKVLITAILGMQHSIAEVDKAKVQAVMKDAAAPAGVKSIATILDHFLHMANAADKETLKKLAA